MLLEYEERPTHAQTHSKVALEDRVRMLWEAPVLGWFRHSYLWFFLLSHRCHISQLRVLANNCWVVLFSDCFNLFNSGFLVLSFTIIEDWVEAQVHRVSHPLDNLEYLALFRVIGDHGLSHEVFWLVEFGDALTFALISDAIHGVEQGEIVRRVVILANLNCIATIRTRKLTILDHLTDAGLAESVAALLNDLRQSFNSIKIFKAKLTLHMYLLEVLINFIYTIINF